MLKRRSIQLNHTGFTLVELVVVLVLMGILLSISAAGLIAFQDQSSKMQKNEAAQTIFIAAQSKLTQMEGNGQIDDLRDRLKYEDGNYSISDYVPVFSPINDEFDRYFSHFITKTVMTSTSLSEEGKSRLAGSQAMLMTDLDIWGTYDDNVLISLNAKAGDYDLYVQNPASLPVQTQILFELIEDTVADQEVLNGAICLEIAPEEGQVFSAFYSDTAYEFYYGNSERGSSGRVDIAQRHDGARTNKGLGYYGVNTLTHVTYIPTTGISLGELTVDNGNTLSYHLAIDETSNIDLNDLTYVITVYDSTTSRKALEFTVDGKDVANKSADIMDNMVDCATIRYDVTETSTNLGTYRIPIYKEQLAGESVPGIGFILDAADEAATTELLEEEAYDIRNGRAPDGTFARSLSFFRFGTWTEIEGAWTDNIFVMITVTSDDLDEPAVARSKSTSPMFADASLDTKIGQGSTGDNNYKRYGIENCRHFYNMRYYEDVEITTLGLPDAHASELNKFRITFVLRDDLDWGEFAKTSYYASSKKYFSDQITDHMASSLDFPSFKMLRQTDTLTGLREEEALTVAQALEAKYPTYGINDVETLTETLENNWTIIDPTDVDKKRTIRIPDMLEDNLQLSYTITNLNVTMQSNLVYGLYRNYASDRDLPTGLFLENLGTIKYFAVDQISVVGKNKVGAICGANRGNLLYVGTLSTRTNEHKNPSVVQGIKYVGGVFGYQASIGTLDYTYANRDLFINYLTNHAWVSGTMYVGGITSYVVNGDQTKINDTGSDTEDYAKIRHIAVRYCENYGLIRGVYQPQREGETIDPEDAEAVLAHRQSVRYIGGIVGYMNNIKNWPDNIAYNSNRITACYSCPVLHEEYDKELLDQLARVKEIKHYQIAQADQEEVLKTLQEYNVGYCVGGIVGYAGQIIIDSCGVRITDNKITDGYGNELASGYIFGDQYVGGIIGYNDSYIVGSSTNVMTVCGNDYVGGIIGINVHAAAQTTEEERTELVEIDIEGTKGNYSRANGIINRGYVFGLYDYVGGVAGYNAGNLENSRTEAFGDAAPVISGRNYVGGITGRTQGSGTAGGQTVLAAVNGENYVGGLIGYVGPTDPVPKASTFEGGSVYANGSFAGGIAGIVMNPAIYGYTYNSRPKELTGRYFAGGVFGGSIISPSGSISMNMWVGKENEQTLDMHGTAFVGGSIGYNILGNAAGDVLEAGAARLSGTASMEDALTVSSEGRSQQEVVNLVWTMENEKAFGTTDYSFQIVPSHNAHCINVNSITPIEADGYENKLVYVAGVVGYNGNDTILNLKNMNNRSKFRTVSIRATSMEVNMEKYNMETHQMETVPVRCSYAGSMVGCNNARSTIENCIGNTTFSSDAVYRGGICEINKGTILTPQLQLSVAYDLYMTTDENPDYIGGICGRNEGTIQLSASQKIEKCRQSGHDVVGMLCAENYGLIDTKYLNDFIVNGHSYVGGMTGRNFGTINIGDRIQSVQANGADDGYGAGMITGFNCGSINNTTGGELVFKNSGCVYSGDAAGGLIGEQYGAITLQDINVSIQIYPGPSRIKAAAGASGGFIGRANATNGDIILDDCNFVNIDRACVASGLQAGGIIGDVVLYGDHNVTVRNCLVTDELQKQNAEDTLAGIVNRARYADESASGYLNIQNCTVATLVQNSSDRMKAAGIIYDAGGVTRIDRCRAYAPEVGYGITATPAYSITNCFDGTRRGIANFGTVVTPSEDTMTNNYCFIGKTTAAVDNTEYPEELKNSFAGEPLQTTSYTADGKHTFYITYQSVDPDTGNTDPVTINTGYQITTAQLGDLNSIDRFYGRYNNASNGVKLWQAMDEQFVNYIAAHSVDSGIE